MLMSAIKLVAGVAILVAGVPAAAMFFWNRLQLVDGLPPYPAALGIGLACGVALILWKKPNWLIHTLIHEACHAIACVLLGVRVHNFQATDGKGGAVIHDKTDPLRTIIIALAPYTLPLLMAPVLIIRTLMDPGRAEMIVTGFVGFLLTDHLHGLYHNVRLNFWGKQADLTRAGKLLSIGVIASCLFLVLAWWLHAVYAE